MSSTDNPRLLARMAGVFYLIIHVSVSLSFFGVFCVLIGSLIFKSRFFPAYLGVLMALGGLSYLINGLTTSLALPAVAQ